MASLKIRKTCPQSRGGGLLIHYLLDVKNEKIGKIGAFSEGEATVFFSSDYASDNLTRAINKGKSR